MAFLRFRLDSNGVRKNVNYNSKWSQFWAPCRKSDRNFPCFLNSKRLTKVLITLISIIWRKLFTLSTIELVCNTFSIYLTSNIHCNCAFRRVAVSVDRSEIQVIAAVRRKIFAVYERRDIFVDANIVSKDWSCDVHPHWRITERHFENSIRAEENLWLFII